MTGKKTGNPKCNKTSSPMLQIQVMRAALLFGEKVLKDFEASLTPLERKKLEKAKQENG